MFWMTLVFCFLVWLGGYAVAKAEHSFVGGKPKKLRMWSVSAVLLFAAAYGWAFVYLFPLLA